MNKETLQFIGGYFAGCEKCISLCPVEAIDLLEGKARINQNRCIKCGRCKTHCPTGAMG